MARDRTTKGLAKRIELTYYQRLHPFRRWWRILCIALPSAAALWLIAMAALGDQRIYTSGPVATAHRMFNTECERCHVDRPKPAAPAAKADGAATATAKPAAMALPISTAPHPGGFFRRVSDGACLTCHDAAVHHDNEVLSLQCADCHLEHKVSNTLDRMTDRHCTICHADLKTKSGAPPFEREVVSLARHPEFAVFRKNVKDATQVKLNHETHLKPDLPAGGGKRRTLTCVSCHVQDDAGKYMRPISFDLHCKECHPLEASADVVVPHQRPDIIRGFLLSRSVARGGGAAASPAAAPGAEKPADKPAEEEAPKGRRRGGGSSALPDALVRLVGWVQEAVGTTERPPIQLVQRQRGGAAPEAPAAPAEDSGAAGGRRRGGAPAEGAPAAPPAASGGGGGGVGGGMAAVAQLERGLYEGRSAICPFCHMIEKADPLPRIVPPKIPVRWLPHSSFDHRAHRPLACLACHPDARKSTDTADVLLPKMAVCQECHREGGGARAGCVECHLYHDRSKERSPDGPHTVPQLAVTAGRSTAAPATKP